MIMNSPSNEMLRQEHDALQTQLATRHSTTHFAHAAVSSVLTFVFGGAALKLKDDLPEDLFVVWMSAFALAALFAGYCLTRFLLGRTRLRDEQGRFEKLKALRSQLGIDEPARWT